MVLDGIKPEQLDDILAGNTTYQQPTSASVYKMRLAYSGIDNGIPNITVTDANGNRSDLVAQLGANFTVKQVADSDTYYAVDPDGVNYIPETGEVIMGENVYNQIKNAQTVSVNYDKSKFAVGDLRPEMYFNCTQHKTMADGTIQDTDYTVDKAGQAIKYEVNFNQYVTVNTEGKDFIKHDMGNKIEDLAGAVQDVLDIEKTITKLKGMLDDPQYKNDTDAVNQINKMLEGADVELALKKENMQKLFGNNISNFQNFMEDVSSVQAKVGTTYSKLELIETRVTEQLSDFKELKSSNEDVETEEAAIEMYQAELVYESSLATTASVIQKTLLDYL